jgi:hypothetical protein
MERKLRPGRLKGIPAHQRRAIRRALNFAPGRRFADADAFLKAMGLQDSAPGGRLRGFLPGALAGALAGILLTLAVINPDGFLQRTLGTTGAPPQPVSLTRAPVTGTGDAQPQPAGPPVAGEMPGNLSAGATFSPAGNVAGSEPAEPESEPPGSLTQPGPEPGPESGPDAPPADADGSGDVTSPPAPAVIPVSPEPVPPPQAGPGRLQLDASSYSVDESSAVLIVRVIRTGGSRGAVAFRWRTQPGSATPDQDYVSSDWQRVELANGEVGTRLFVPLVNDGRAEAGETFTLEIADAEGGAELGPRTRAEVRIVDDDPPVSGR